METWKTIEEHEKYQISNLGRVKSFAKGKSRILRQSTHKGYLVVSLDGKYKVVHRLVAKTFIENSENKPVVDHINGDRFNNNLNNLRWATYSENAKNKNQERNYSYETFSNEELINETWGKPSFIEKDNLLVSNLGRVKYYKKYGKSGKFSKEIIKEFGSSDTYPSFSYIDNHGQTKRIKVHILVWRTFNGDVLHNLQVNHIDGNKSNCRLSNLNLLTASDNIKHNYVSGLFKKCVFYSDEKINNILYDYYFNHICQDQLIPKHRVAAEDIIPILQGIHPIVVYTEKQKKLTQNYRKFIQYHLVYKSITFQNCEKIYEYKCSNMTNKKIGEIYNLTDSSIRIALTKIDKYRELKSFILMVQNEYESYK
jgi:hypothetical protein